MKPMEEMESKYTTFVEEHQIKRLHVTSSRTCDHNITVVLRCRGCEGKI
jgi:hypothetical protein